MKKNAVFVFSSFCFSLLIMQHAWAADSVTSRSQIEALTQKADAGDKKALSELEKIGGAGSALAQYHLGLKYAYKDEATGLKWFRLAADQGHCGSLTYLGSFYRSTNRVLSLAIEKVAINNAERSGNSTDLFNVKNVKANWPYRYEEFTKDQQTATNKLIEELEKPGNFLTAVDAYINKK